MDLDPYRDWLKIRETAGPANHYQLLGLPGPSASPAEIEAAYAHRMQTVRRYQLGVHMEIAQRLIGELSEAYVCLSDVRAKRAYDVTLAGGTTLDEAPAATVSEVNLPAPASITPHIGKPPTTPLPRPKPLTPVVKMPVVTANTPPSPAASPGVSASAAMPTVSSARRRQARRRTPPALIAAGVVGLLAIVVGWFAFNLPSSSPSLSPPEVKVASSTAPVRPAAAATPQRSPAAVVSDPPLVTPTADAPSEKPPEPPTATASPPRVDDPPAVATVPPKVAALPAPPPPPPPPAPPMAPAVAVPRTLAPATTISPRQLARPVNGVAWSPDSTRLLLAAEPAVLVDVLTGQELQTLATSECARASWSFDGRFVAMHLYQKPPIVSVYEVAAAKQVLAVETYKAGGWLFGFSPTAASLAVIHPKGSKNLADLSKNLVTLIKLGPGKQSSQTLDEFLYPARLTWKPDGTSLAWAMYGANRGVRVSRTLSRNNSTLLPATVDFEELVWVPNQRLLAGFSKEGMSVIDLAAPKKTPVLQLAGVTKPSLGAFSSDGVLAAAIVGTEILTFALDDAKAPRWTKPPGQFPWRTLAWSPTVPRLAAMDSGGTIHVWDAEGQLIATLRANLTASSVAGLAFSPDGLRLVAFGQNYNLVLFDTSKL